MTAMYRVLFWAMMSYSVSCNRHGVVAARLQSARRGRS